ncbi:hypothetical protein GGR58DRAFT_323486 [Xylaria digitata]|nr:hypothetical protein GGR58DRAFT_323486 [Xylaria digitata]
MISRERYFATFVLQFSLKARVKDGDGFGGFRCNPYPGQHHRSWHNLESARIQGFYIYFRLCEDQERLESASFPLKYCFFIKSRDDASIEATDKGTAWKGTLRYELIISGFWDRFPVKSNPQRSSLQELAIRSSHRVWTGHEDIAALAYTWVDRCLKGNAGRSKSFLSEWKPSRLLDVSEDKIKLVLGEEAQGPYITLSHAGERLNSLFQRPLICPRSVVG